MESLYNKYRPQSLSEMKGNKTTIRAIESKLEKEAFPHSSIFYGPKGCGKTTLARIISKEVGCNPIDIVEMNCADDTGIDPVRNINRLMRNRPMGGKYRCWIMDEVHRLTSTAQSALFKTLEEPPDHCYFFLCTTDYQKLMEPIRSRCTPFEVEPLNEQSMMILLLSTCKKEGKPVPKSILESIIQDSLGCSRNALVVLEKIIDLKPEDMEKAVTRETAKANQIINLCRAFIKRESWKKIASIANSLEDSPEEVRRSILGYCRAILSKEDNAMAYLIASCFLEKTFFYTGKDGLLITCYEAFNEIQSN